MAVAANGSIWTFDNMALLLQEATNSSKGYPDLAGVNRPSDLKVQLVIAFGLGISAFLAFCVCSCRRGYPNIAHRFS